MGAGGCPWSFREDSLTLSRGQGRAASPELTLSLAFLCRKPGDGVEFFAQMRLILKKGEGRQGLPCPEVRTARSCCPQPLLQQAPTP